MNVENSNGKKELIKEFEIDHAYLISIEKAMFFHFRFFVVFIISELAAGAAIIKLIDINEQFNVIRIILLILSILAFCIFYFGRFMYLELRIRKIKMIEQLARIRKFWQEKYEDISDNFILISGIEKSPPYLRIGCSEWYSLLFLSLWLAISAALTIYFFCDIIVNRKCNDIYHSFIFTNPITTIIFTIILIIIIFLWSYCKIMRIAIYYDAKRKHDFIVENRYNLLEHRGENLGWIFKPFILYKKMRGSKIFNSYFESIKKQKERL